MSIITSFRAGLAFFTRIPVGSAPLPPTLSGVVAWLPAVGLLVGALAALALLLAARLGLPAALCGIGATLVWTVITGGLHLDGVADCGDGLLVETSPERRLTIMKDSRLGSFGALALFVVLSTKVAALAALAGTTPLHALGACCLAGLLGRCQVFVGMRLPSARPGGLGSMMHDGMKPRYAYTALGDGTAWPLRPAGGRTGGLPAVVRGPQAHRRRHGRRLRGPHRDHGMRRAGGLLPAVRT